MMHKNNIVTSCLMTGMASEKVAPLAKKNHTITFHMWVIGNISFLLGYIQTCTAHNADTVGT